MNEPSGGQWAARYPTSSKVEDLIEPFRENVSRFLDALRAGGAAVTVSATYRPAERAYLMHWSCMIAKSGQDPAAVPPVDGVPIDWTHGGDLAAARKAAADMVARYDIAFPAALVSRHTQRRAIDMTIRFPLIPTIVRDAGGSERSFAAQVDLVPIGRTYGVVKLASDPPHWSDDGHW